MDKSTVTPKQKCHDAGGAGRSLATLLGTSATALIRRSNILQIAIEPLQCHCKNSPPIVLSWKVATALNVNRIAVFRPCFQHGGLPSYRAYVVAFFVPTQTDGQAEQFVDFYYKTFDSDRNNLAALYVRLRQRLALEALLADVLYPSATNPCSPSRRNHSKAAPPSLRSSP